MESNYAPSSSPTAEKTCRLVSELNRTEVKFDSTKCVQDLLEEQARRTPTKTAVVFRDQALTYRALQERADRLACRLRSLGVGRDTIVAIYMKRSLDVVAALWAVLKAGGAYLPLDPSFPAARVEFMLSDSKACVILTERKLQSRFEGQRSAVLPVDGDWQRDSYAAIETDRRGARPVDLAYLIYTSGSTGTPKGVMVEHRNVVNFFAAMDTVIGYESGVWLAVTSISFDISVLELLWTLSRGFTVIVQAEEDKLAPGGDYSVAEQLTRHNVTHLQCTPTFAHMLCRSADTLAAMNALRRLLLGGEALPVALANQLSQTLAAEIHNMYGPTETTVWSTSYKLAGRANAIPIGKPVANTQTYILDERHRLVVVGEVGELYIGGDGVARGYWGRAELTAERFIPNPFSDRASDRLYKTGDLARLRADGNIEFLGRTDHQVKIRGFRVELGEIETVLGQHPSVQEVVVIPREDSTQNPMLAAYVVTKPRLIVTQKELQIFARQRLPEYMVPSVMTSLDRMPVTPNGKVDRKALPILVASSPADDIGIGTRTELEVTLAQIWQDVLGVDAVGLRNNFFDLGATSLTLAEAAATMREVLKREIHITDLFAYPTISSFVAYLSRANVDVRRGETAADRGAVRRASLASRTRPAVGVRGG
jgi:amino acid adenylation domain-containing protein